MAVTQIIWHVMLYVIICEDILFVPNISDYLVLLTFSPCRQTLIFPLHEESRVWSRPSNSTLVLFGI